MKRKIIYYLGLLVAILAVCVFSAFMWRFMNTTEDMLSAIYHIVFMFSPVLFPLMAIPLVNIGAKCGAIKQNWRMIEYYIDNVLFVVISLFVLAFMAANDIIVVESGGDLSGIEVVFYWVGLAVVESVNFSVCFIIEAIKRFLQKKYEKGVLFSILAVVMARGFWYIMTSVLGVW